MSYDGKAITYDEIGNPKTYDGWTHTWEAGRQLATMNKTGNALSFKYNENGVRTSKTYNGITTLYTLIGDKVTYESNGTDSIYYRYDVEGSLISFSLNGTEYFYIRNLQGDITGLLDKDGTVVTEYSYDAWGKLLTTTGTLASTVGVKNPYLYRGYRYDSETGLYYLQSRYYNPKTCRMLNADDTSVLMFTQGDLLGANLFAYCSNNAVMNSDPSGYFYIPLIKIRIEISNWGLVYNMYLTHAQRITLTDIQATGALIAAFCALPIGPILAALIGALGTMIWNHDEGRGVRIRFFHPALRTFIPTGIFSL